MVLLGWLIVGYPAFILGLASMFSFSGCVLECTEPDPLAGALFLGTALVLAAAPVLAGWSIFRPGTRAWRLGLGVVLVLAAVWGFGVVIGAL